MYESTSDMMESTDSYGVIVSRGAEGYSMPDRVSLFTSNVELGRLSQVLYTYDEKEKYIKNLISYIEDGLRLGQDVLLVGLKEISAALNKGLFSQLSQEEYGRIHSVNSLGFSAEDGCFDVVEIIDAAKEISKSRLMENDIRSWLHTNEAQGYGKINKEKLSTGNDVNRIGMLCVHAYNGAILSALEENRLLRIFEYFMTDAVLVYSPLYQEQGEIHDSAVPSINKTQMTLQAAVELHEKKEDFIQFLAHELRNPLTVIRGYASLLLKSDIIHSVTDQEKLQAIADYTDVIDEEIQNILRVEKALSEDVVWDRQMISPRGIVQRTLDVMHRKARFRNIAVKSNINLSDRETIYSNEAALRLIVSNLVSNAIKYSSDGSIIRVHLVMEHSFLKLRVDDHGEGMTEEQVRNLFRRYGKMNHETEGHGIGLFAVKSIVERFNGIIHVESKVEEGTTVTVYLPKQADDVVEQLH